MVNVQIKPIPIWSAQQKFRESKARIRGFFAGRNSGKSKIGCIDILRRAERREPWMAISPNFKSVIETTLPAFIESAEYSDQYIRSVVTPNPRVWFKCETGGTAEIVFVSADNPESLRGPSKAGLWFDEAGLMPHSVFQIGIAMLRWRGRMGPVLITTTPRGTKHWTFTTFYEPTDEPEAKSILVDGRWYNPRPGTEAIKGRTRDNPFAPPDYYETVRDHYTSAFAMQELEGDFIDIAGLMFRRDWFEPFVSQAPRDCMRVRCFDMASTQDGGDWTVGALVAIDPSGVFYVEDVARGQWGPAAKFAEIKRIVEADARRYNGEVLTYIEQEGGSAGKDVIFNYIRDLAGYSVFRYPFTGQKTKNVNGEKLPGQAKITRASPLAAQAEVRNVRFVRGNWNADALEELCAFPMFRHDDQVDAIAMGVQLLLSNNMGDPGTITRTAPEIDSDRFGAMAAVQQVTERRWESLSWLNR